VTAVYAYICVVLYLHLKSRAVLTSNFCSRKKIMVNESIVIRAHFKIYLFKKFPIHIEKKKEKERKRGT